jgi:hypothetical protein
VAAGHQPAVPPAGRAAGDRLSGAVPPAHRRGLVRGAVDDWGAVGAAPLQRRLVPGRQAPQSAAGRVPAPQARPGPRPLLHRHLPDRGSAGAAASRTRPTRAVGAAGPPAPLPTGGGAVRDAAGRGWAAVAGGHRRRPRPAGPPPGPGQSCRSGPRDHPPLRGGDQAGGAADLGPALRAEAYLHLEDQQVRQAKAARRAPSAGRGGRAAGAATGPGCGGSRRGIAAASTRPSTRLPSRSSPSPSSSGSRPCWWGTRRESPTVM